MTTLCIIPCGSMKIWDKKPDSGPQKASNVYIGPFHRKCQEYALKFYPNDWIILSAKHGFLRPNDIIPETYNVSFNLKKTNPITIDELSKQADYKNIDKYDKIVVLGGKNYTKIIETVFKDKDIYNPLSECKGIGYMMQKLKILQKSSI